MTRPRLIARTLSLPTPPKDYDPKHQEIVQKLLEQHVATAQPSQQRQVVSGSKASGAALISLLTALANLGFITDSTVA